MWLAGGLAGTMRWLEILAVGVYTYQASGSPLLVALMLFARMLPNMVLGAFTGAIAARVNRKHLLLMGLGVMCLVSAVLCVLLLVGRAELWHIAVGALLAGVFWSMEFPVRRTVLGEIAGLERIGAAMGLDAATNNATRMLGPLLGGLLLTALGLEGAFALGIVLYAVGFVSVATLAFHDEPRRSGEIRGVLDSIREGLAYIRSERLIAGVLVVTVFVNLFGFAYTSMIPVIGEKRLHLGPVAIGVLMSMEGLGALLGSLGVAFWGRSRYYTTIYLGGSLLFVFMVFAFSLSSWYVLSLGLLFTGGVGIACFGAMQSTLIFSASLPEMRTRVMGVLVACIGAGPIGVLQLGLLAEWIGAHAAVAGVSLVGLLALGLATFKWPELRRPPVFPNV